jgi:hypothetical protein
LSGRFNPMVRTRPTVAMVSRGVVGAASVMGKCVLMGIVI